MRYRISSATDDRVRYFTVYVNGTVIANRLIKHSDAWTLDLGCHVSRPGIYEIMFAIPQSSGWLIDSELEGVTGQVLDHSENRAEHGQRHRRISLISRPVKTLTRWLRLRP